MTLINCRGCEKEVNTDAENCPHCGSPIKSTLILVKESWKDCVGLLLITALFFTLIYISANRAHKAKEQTAVNGTEFTLQNLSDQNEAIVTTGEITTASISEIPSQNSEALQLGEGDKKIGAEMKEINSRYSEFIVIARVLNVRKEPNVNAELVSWLERGEVVYLDRDQSTRGWAPIKRSVNGKEIGYVNLSFLVPQYLLKETHRRSPDSRITRQGYFACINRNSFDNAVEHSVRNDVIALAQIMNSGECIMLKKGIEVTIEDTGFPSNAMTIKPMGTELVLWTNTEAVE